MTWKQYVINKRFEHFKLRRAGQVNRMIQEMLLHTLSQHALKDRPTEITLKDMMKQNLRNFEIVSENHTSIFRKRDLLQDQQSFMAN